MALYERFANGEKIARAFTVDGSAEDLRLRALAMDGTHGWRRAKNVEGSAPPVADPSAPFDPSKHTIEEVLAHLGEAGVEEATRVLDAEASGKARRGIVGQREEILAGLQEPKE
jgi:hypothetical protein